MMPEPELVLAPRVVMPETGFVELRARMEKLQRENVSLRAALEEATRRLCRGCEETAQDNCQTLQDSHGVWWHNAGLANFACDADAIRAMIAAPQEQP